MFRLVVLSALVAVAIAAPSHLHAVPVALTHQQRYDVKGSPVYTTAYTDDSANIHNTVDLHNAHYDDSQLYEDDAHLYANAHEESVQHHLVPEAVAVHKLHQVHQEAPVVDDAHYAAALAHEAHQLQHHAVDDVHYTHENIQHVIPQVSVHKLHHEIPDDAHYAAALAHEDVHHHHVVPETVAVHQVHHEAPIVVDDAHYAAALAQENVHHHHIAPETLAAHQVHHEAIDDAHYAAALAQENVHHLHIAPETLVAHQVHHEAVDDAHYAAALAHENLDLHQIAPESIAVHQAPVLVDDAHYASALAHEDAHHHHVVPEVVAVHHAAPVLVKDAHYAHEHVQTPADTQLLSTVDVIAHDVHHPAVHHAVEAPLVAHDVHYNVAPAVHSVESHESRHEVHQVHEAPLHVVASPSVHSVIHEGAALAHNVHAVEDIHVTPLVAPALAVPSIHSESSSSVQHSVSAPGYHVASSHSVHEVKNTPAVVHGVHGVHASVPVAVSHSARTDVHKTASVVAHPVVGYQVNAHGVHGIHGVHAW